MQSNACVTQTCFFFFRLCRTPSPRKCRLFESRGSEPDIGFNVLNSGLQLSSPDDEEIDEDAPLCAFSPVRPNSLENRLERDTPQNKLKRRLFVANLPSYVSLDFLYFHIIHYQTGRLSYDFIDINFRQMIILFSFMQISVIDKLNLRQNVICNIEWSTKSISHGIWKLELHSQ